MSKKERNQKLGILYSILMVISVIYLEIVFLVSTIGLNSAKDIIYILFFGLFYGLIICLLGSLCKKTKINKIIRCVLLFLIALPYLVQYFVYKKFQVMYDLKTVFAGGGGAVGEFQGDIIRLIFCVNGIVHIILFLLPFILYVATCWKFDAARRFNLMKSIVFIVGAVFCYVISSLFILFSSADKGTYNEEYNYTTAIQTFGLSTALRLEVKNLMFPKDYGFGFDTTTNPVDDEKIDANDISQLGELDEVGWDDEEHIQVTKRNELEIDFEALSSSASGDVADLDKYVASLTPSSKNERTGMFRGKNLIFISAEAFSKEAIDPKLTPTLYRFATKGIQFTDFYQPASAGTTGGEYSNIMGMLPSNGGSSMKETATHNNYMTVGSQLNRMGYYGKAFHNNSYTFYDRDKTHINLGYSDGYMGYGNGMEEYITHTWPESDLEMMQATLPMYIDKEPFNIYYMSVSGHSDYSPTLNSMSKKHWDEVQELKFSDTVKAYYAAQMELDRAMEYLVAELEKAGKLNDTVICISPDHFPYGLDAESPSGTFPFLEELYGEKVTSDLMRDHNIWLLWSGCLEDKEPIVVDAPTFAPDILPTLLNLFGAEYDSRLLPGRDVFSDAQPLVYNLGYEWKTDLGTYVKGSFTPVSEDADIPDGYVESIKQIVKNKIMYSQGVLDQDYYRHVFGDEK